MACDAMTDRDALECSIVLNPAEDVLRLALADELEENPHEDRECPRCGGDGDDPMHPPPYHKSCRGPCNGTGRISLRNAEHAEFIRVGCELARTASGSGHNYTDEELSRGAGGDPLCGCVWCGLRRRERELLAVGRAAGWFDALGWETRTNDGEIHWMTLITGGPIVRATVSRGFPSAITCTRAAWDAVGEVLVRRFPVERVTWTDAEPYKHRSDEWFWFSGSDDYDQRRPALIPKLIFAAAETTGIGKFGGTHWKEDRGLHSDWYHPTREAALAALSDAILTVTREKAGRGGRRGSRIV